MQEHVKSFFSQNGLKLIVATVAILCAAGMGWLLVASKQPTPQETALGAILLTVFSTAASYLVTKVYAEVAYSQTLRDHGVQIARSIILLQNQVEHLGTWVSEKREVMHADPHRVSADATLEHVEQTLGSFQGMTDVALNGITQVIGDAWAQYQTIMDKMAKLRREESKEITTIQQEFKATGTNSAKAAELKVKLERVAHETEKRISELVKNSPLPIFQAAKRTFSAECPHCSEPNLFEISDRPGETKKIVCHSCRHRFNAHLSGDHQVLVRPDPLAPPPVIGSFKDEVEELLRRTEAFVAPEQLNRVIEITLAADREITDPADRTPHGLLTAVLRRDDDFLESGISKMTARRLHKLLYLGRAFTFAGNGVAGSRRPYVPDLTYDVIRSAYLRGCLGRIATNFEIHASTIPDLSQLLLPPETPDGERVIAENLQEILKKAA